MGRVLQNNAWFAAQDNDLDAWVAGSPFVLVEFVSSN
jgi:hypothetical protein